LKEVNAEILTELADDAENIFGNGKDQKNYGEATYRKGDCKVTLRKRRTVKYDNEQMIAAGQKLSWDELNRFFKVKFDMGETEHKELEAAALDSEKFSDVLSRVDDAREVSVGAVEIANITVEE
jgi:hypothetical protein